MSKFDHLQIISADARHPNRLSVRLGDGDVLISGGGGGWEAVTRPGRRPITVWRGPDDAYRLQVPLLFDGYRSNDSVEGDIATLKRLCGMEQAGDPEPPKVYLQGALLDGPRKGNGRLYVIEKSPEWGACIRNARHGYRIRQEVTVTFMLFSQDDKLRSVPNAAHPRFAYLNARKGDTYEKIAARKLDTRRLGPRLARLNGGRSPDVHLKAGKRVKYPVGAELNAWKADLKRGS